MRAFLLALALGGFAAGGPEAPSPSAVVTSALQAQRAVGYSPCEPRVSQLSTVLVAPGVLGAAATPGDPGVECEVWLSASLAPEVLVWVAWHEVCHLSTSRAIHADLGSALLVDPIHEHSLFVGCLGFGPDDRGGY